MKRKLTVLIFNTIGWSCNILYIILLFIYLYNIFSKHPALLIHLCDILPGPSSVIERQIYCFWNISTYINNIMAQVPDLSASPGTVRRLLRNNLIPHFTPYFMLEKPLLPSGITKTNRIIRSFSPIGFSKCFIDYDRLAIIF